MLTTFILKTEVFCVCSKPTSKLPDLLWFGEMVLNRLPHGGFVVEDVRREWNAHHREAAEGAFTKETFHYLRLLAEENYQCVFVCDKRKGNLWTLEGDESDVATFRRRVNGLKDYLR